VGRPAPIVVDAFRFLRSATTRTAKITIPSPCMLYSQVGRANISRAVYQDLDGFVEDTAAAYRAEIADLYAAGCCYLQLDGVSLAYLCYEGMRAGAGARRGPGRGAGPLGQTSRAGSRRPRGSCPSISSA
jgi:5-methyltetrahydropteroyltriglutamate--homocysteine methyltransferase